jgi:hypothetical protein
MSQTYPATPTIYRASAPTDSGTGGLPLEADKDFAPPDEDEKDDADTKEEKPS